MESVFVRFRSSLGQVLVEFTPARTRSNLIRDCFEFGSVRFSSGLGLVGESLSSRNSDWEWSVWVRLRLKTGQVRLVFGSGKFCWETISVFLEKELTFAISFPSIIEVRRTP